MPRAVFALLAFLVSQSSGTWGDWLGRRREEIKRGWAGFFLKFLTASRLGVGSWFLRHSCPAHMVGAAGAEKHEYFGCTVQYLTAPKRAAASPQWSSAWPISAVEGCRAGVGSAWGVAKVSAFDSSGGLVSGAPQRRGEGRGRMERREEGNAGPWLRSGCTLGCMLACLLACCWLLSAGTGPRARVLWGFGSERVNPARNR